MRTRGCEEIREVVSASLDGEEGPFPLVEAEIHLASCVECAAFRHSCVELHRRARINPAPSPTDRTDEIFARLDAQGVVRTPAPSRARDVRILLVFVALLQLAVAVPMLLGRIPGLDGHTARHIGAFTVAVGAGFAYVAWRPRAAPGLLPVVTVLVVMLLATSVVDVARGVESVVAELTEHAAEIIGLALVWLLARSSARRTISHT